ncbi:cutinase family protein [Corynebacterium lizhenjunii]|uniref:Cutinase family protein n=1 Tax=Corynebacterium lizhenjunii TaxID=2709394 RepID=A0A7T0KFH0_9CORY|nr:cutinase family protein [Corynebacterium lizhenjunii]QPK79009.1 cutinase family protein [Corynebacterium lizhenjunii]
MKKFLTVVAVLIVLVLIGGGAMQYFQARQEPAPQDSAAPEPPAPAEPAQPEWCPAVEFISAPGTWESAADDDPLHPQANPRSFMLSISQPLQDAYAPDDVKVWTLPYTAQFKNINAQDEMSYDESRQEGTVRVEQELAAMHADCPRTKFIMAGFSQGAVLVGDVADAIGAGQGPIPADAVAGVALVADGRRQNEVGINPGNPLGGIGAEIALAPVNRLVQPVVPGASMRGPRPNGFGELADRTFQICAPDDSICDAPHDVPNGVERALGLISANGVHAQYATNPNVIPGTTANAWVVDWAHQLIAQSR